jgi:uncharacterized protein YndB with AHSA1/START domain
MTLPDRVERIELFSFPIERVWAAITTPEKLASWFDAEVHMDFRVGGEIRFYFIIDGEKQLVPAVIETIEPLHRFAFRWRSFKSDPDLPLVPGQSTLVEFTLEKIAGGTKLTLVESGFASLPEDIRKQSYEENCDGWKEGLAILHTYLENEAENRAL